MGATVGATGGLIVSVLADLAPIQTGIAGFLVGTLAAYLYGLSHPIKEEDWTSFPGEDAAEEPKKEP